MRDSEYILSELIKTIKDNLESVEHRLVSGAICHIEEYKYNLGARCTLYALSDRIKELSRGN
jgi:hypothetical protein